MLIKKIKSLINTSLNSFKISNEPYEGSVCYIYYEDRGYKECYAPLINETTKKELKKRILINTILASVFAVISLFSLFLFFNDLIIFSYNKISIESGNLVFLILDTALLFLMSISLINVETSQNGLYLLKRHLYPLKDNEEITEFKCESCGGVYVINTVFECPHCKRENAKRRKQEK